MDADIVLGTEANLEPGGTRLEVWSGPYAGLAYAMTAVTGTALLIAT